MIIRALILRFNTPDDIIHRIQKAINNFSRAEIESTILSTNRGINRYILNHGNHSEHLSICINFSRNCFQNGISKENNIK